MTKIVRLLCILALTLVLHGHALAQDTPDIVWQRQGHTDHLHSIIYSKSQQYLISGGGDRLIKFWRITDGAALRTLNGDAPETYVNGIESLAITPDATRLASGLNSGLALWHLPNGTKTSPAGPTGVVFAVKFSPAGDYFASAGDDGIIRIRRASDGIVLNVLRSHPRRVRALAFSPDGKFLASGAGDNTVKIWRTSDWSLVRTLSQHTGEIRAVAFNPSGSIFASAGEDSVVKLWSTSNWELLRNLVGHASIINTLAFSPDGTTLASSDNDTMRMWRVNDGSVIKNYTSEVVGVGGIEFMDNNRFAYGRFDGKVILARLNQVSQPPPTLSGPPYTLLLQNFDGRLGQWRMNGNQRTETAAVRKGPTSGTGWRIAGFADMNGDSSPDVIWQNNNLIAVWFMEGPSFVSSSLLEKKAATGWKIVAVGDFNSDGKNDFLFQDGQRRLAVWFMDGFSFVSSALLRNGQPITENLRLAGAGDFNKDNNTDILLRKSDGSFVIWFFQGTEFSSSAQLRNGEVLGNDWRVAGVRDFDGDNTADILCQHTDGSLRIWLPTRTNFAGAHAMSVKLPVATGWRIRGCR